MDISMRGAAPRPIRVLLIIWLMISVVSLAQAALPRIPVLTVELAQKAAAAALAQCRKDGYQVSVSVVDHGGTLLTLLRDPKAGPHTVSSSQGKAFTSASMGMPTARYAQLIAEKPELAALRDMDPRILILGGGLPITLEGERVGGIGVGGAPGAHLDEACARQGLRAIGVEE